MVLFQKLASDLLIEVVWTNCQEWWTVLVLWLVETGHTEISGEDITLAQLEGLIH